VANIIRQAIPDGWVGYTKSSAVHRQFDWWPVEQQAGLFTALREYQDDDELSTAG